MTTNLPALSAKERKDLRLLALFSAVYCRAHHPGVHPPIGSQVPVFAGSGAEHYALCAICCEVLAYAVERRRRCPLNPKPSCKHCPIHCYRPGHREKVREIMRFSGRQLLLRGRFDLLWHYFF